jgi:hypothetical protein
MPTCQLFDTLYSNNVPRLPGRVVVFLAWIMDMGLRKRTVSNSRIEQVWFPDDLKLDVWVAGLVLIHGRLEASLFEIAPRTEEVGVDDDVNKHDEIPTHTHSMI